MNEHTPHRSAMAYTRNILIWVIICIVGVGLRFAYLDQPVRYDEAFTYNQYAGINLPTVLSDYSQPNNHILHTVLVYLATRTFGDNLWVIRLPALLIGIALIFVQYRVTRYIFGHGTALFAAALVSISAPLIEFSVNARGYTLVVLITLLLIYHAKRIADDPSGSPWWPFVVYCALGMFTIPVMLYVVGGLSLWLLSELWRAAEHDEKLPRLARWVGTMAVTGGLTVLLYVPVMLGTGLGSLVGNEFVARLDTETFYAGIPTIFEDMTTLPNEGFHISLVVLLGLGVLVGTLRNEGLSGNRWPFLWSIVGFSAVLLFFQQVIPFERTWILFIPAYFMLAAAGVTALTQNRGWLWLFIIPLLGLSATEMVLQGVVPSSERTGVLPGVVASAERLQELDEERILVLAPIPIDEPLLYYLRDEENILIRNQFDLTRLDLQQAGRILSLTEEQTSPAVLEAMGISVTSLTVQLQVIEEYEDLYLQDVRFVPIDTNPLLYSERLYDPAFTDWKVTRVLVAEEEDYTRLVTDNAWGVMELRGGTSWSDYRVVMRVRVIKQAEGFEAVYLGFRDTDAGRYITTLDMLENRVSLFVEEGDETRSQSMLGRAPLRLAEEQFYEIDVDALADDIVVSIDGREVLEIQDSTFGNGNIRLLVPPRTILHVEAIDVWVNTANSPTFIPQG